MDKKNVQNWDIKNTLTDEKFRLHRKNLWCRLKRKHLKIISIKFYIFCGKVFRNFFYYHYMIVNDSDLVPKSSILFCCKLCDYSTCKKSQFNRHLSTDKHQNHTNDSKMVGNGSDLVPKSSNYYKCECGKIYKYDSGYYRHKKICKPTLLQEKNPSNLDKDDLIIALLKQNSELLEIVKNGTIITNNTNTNTNCMNNNKTFNLQFFLNETCKDAMNIMDFVDSIKLQLTDLEKVGEVGYVEGISNIITTNLKALDVSLRPVHCTDRKRETIYIKDENQWTKEDDNKSKLRKAIKKVANNNIRMLPKYREKNPKYSDSSSRVSDKYDKMVIEIMGGMGNNDLEKEDKIIHNISKCTTIEKYQELK
jgi:hypothetical protein